MKKITKAVIPAAGLGTRMLPQSKSVPKEMLPIVDKPSIQYLVEEAVAAGAEDILVITNRDKDCIEDYFDYSPEYEKKLSDSGKTKELENIRAIADMANIYFLRQKTTRGLGHAVGRTRSFVGNEPFMVLYGDDVIDAEVSTSLEMAKLYEEFGRPVVGVQNVSREAIRRYCTLDAKPIRDRVWSVCDMIEKPREDQIMTTLSILGRVILTPDVFDILETIPAGAGGEIQLTDAMAIMARKEPITAYEFPGTRHDMGSKIGFLKANVSLGVKNPDFGDEFKTWLKDFAAKL
ncbi:MAG: UTP--glucose-1-phosphate uridylyltransferase [Clostridia bacterium]|nr:UTP--glucose-1-phosphate uridylyltransferase [Clostridia bacterium]